MNWSPSLGGIWYLSIFFYPHILKYFLSVTPVWDFRGYLWFFLPLIANEKSVRMVNPKMRLHHEFPGEISHEIMVQLGSTSIFHGETALFHHRWRPRQGRAPPRLQLVPRRLAPRRDATPGDARKLGGHAAARWGGGVGYIPSGYDSHSHGKWPIYSGFSH